MTDYRVVERKPTVAEFNGIRRAAGLSAKNRDAAEKGIANSLLRHASLSNDQRSPNKFWNQPGSACHGRRASRFYYGLPQRSDGAKSGHWGSSIDEVFSFEAFFSSLLLAGFSDAAFKIFSVVFHFWLECSDLGFWIKNKRNRSTWN